MPPRMSAQRAMARLNARPKQSIRGNALNTGRTVVSAVACRNPEAAGPKLPAWALSVD